MAAPLLNFRAAASALIQRYRGFRSMGLTFDGRRNMWGILGYPETLGVQDFIERYERGGVAGRVVDVLPDGTWRGEMYLEEVEDLEKETDFELAWKDMEKRLAIRQRFHQTDVLSRLSTYSVLLLGTADGDFNHELPKGTPDQLLYLQPYLGAGSPTSMATRGSAQGVGAEADVTIAEFDVDPKSPRFALPLYYTLRRPDIVSVDVFQKPIHWSRVIHVAEGTLRDDIFGRPALQRIWNHLEDLDKVVGGGSEAFWLRSNAGIHLNVDPTMQMTASGQEELKKLAEQAEEYQHQLTRMIRTRGVEVNQLGSDVANFQSPADVLITLIAGSCGIPKRLLVGSERGELASTQDRENFRDLISGRQTNFAAPKIVRPFVDRLIEYGYLPTPKEYKVVWPTIEVMSETEKSQGASGWASVNSAMGKTVFTEEEIRDKWAGLKPLTEKQKKAIEEEAAKKMKEQQELMASKTESLKEVKGAPAGGPPSKDKEEEEPIAASAVVDEDDEMVRVLQSALEAGADDVVASIVGLGGPGSGRYPKGSAKIRGAAEAELRTAIIRKVDGKFVLFTRDGKRRLGTHDTYAEAAAQEKAIEISKRRSRRAENGALDQSEPRRTIFSLTTGVWPAETSKSFSDLLRDLGGPGSGRYPKGSGKNPQSGVKPHTGQRAEAEVATSHRLAPHQTGASASEKRDPRAFAGESPLHLVAEAHEPKFSVAFRYAFARGRQAVKKSQNLSTVAARATSAIADALDEVLPKMLHAVAADGGEVGADLVNRRFRAMAHAHATTQVNLPPEVAAQMVAFPIDEADLAEQGRELDPHITVKYGVHGSPNDVREALAGEALAEATMGKTIVFEGVEDGTADAVVVQIHSDCLRRWNKKISESVDSIENSYDYEPHATIAYVKPGLGQKYAGDSRFEGTALSFDRIVFSSKDDQIVSIPLDGLRAAGGPGSGRYPKGSGQNPQSGRDPLHGEPHGQHTPTGQQKLIDYLEQTTGEKFKPHGSVARGETSSNDFDLTIEAMTQEEAEQASHAADEAVSKIWDKVSTGELTRDQAMEQIYGDAPHPVDEALARIGFTPVHSVEFDMSPTGDMGHPDVVVQRYENTQTGHSLELWIPLNFRTNALRAAKRDVWTTGFGMSFNSQNPSVIEWAKKHAAELIEQITETTRERIREAVVGLQQDGDWDVAYDKILNAVGDETRADLIARHETMLAAGEGQRLAWGQAEDQGLLSGRERREWIITEDERVCPICAQLAGAIAPLNGVYPGGIDGPPAHVQCRCTEGIIG